MATFGAPLAAGIVTASPASADTVVDGCTIVSNPTPTNFTNCIGANLSGANLSGVDLSYANLFLADLSGADLSNANLSSAGIGSLSGDLSNANLTSANLTAARLADCIVFGIHGVICVSADFTGANLTGANFTNATFTSCASSPLGSGCGSANFTDTLLVPSDQFITATSAGAVVTWPTPPSLPGATPGTCTPPSGSTFAGTTTVSCQVLDNSGGVAYGDFDVTINPTQTTTNLFSNSPHPSLSGQSVTYSVTVSPTPPGGTVAFTDDGSSIGGCSAVPFLNGIAGCTTTPSPGTHNIVATYSGYTNSAGADFPGSTSPSFTWNALSCKALAGCNLSGLNLSNATFGGADLHGANLVGANLTGAFLVDAYLGGANLLRANLSGADFYGANLKGANLNNVTWSNTTCPDGTNSDNDGGTCVGHL